MKIDYRNKEIINGNVIQRIHDARVYNIEYSCEKNELKFFLIGGFFGENFEVIFKNVLSVSMNDNANFFESIINGDIICMSLNERAAENIPIMVYFNKIPLEHIVDVEIYMSNAVLNIACEEIEFITKETELSRRLAEETQ